MKKIIVVFGTRPEAIKMCPLVKELKKVSYFETKVCVTGQHREMVNQVLQIFDVVPDFDLNIMRENQSLSEITALILIEVTPILNSENPDIVLVHGDTSSAFATSLACFYVNTPVGHVEAGLRTHNLMSPFPEEFNRQAIGLTAKFHFAPTEQARNNLLSEGKEPASIFVTGNTGIDALKETVINDYVNDDLEWASDSKLILITAHRRENIGHSMDNMFTAVKRIVDDFPNVKVVYPLHLNPKVRKSAQAILGNTDRIRLIEPLDVIDFHNILARCFMVLTDSGGVQEEATFLGKPVLVMRDTTERSEGIEAGALKLVGTEEEVIYENCKQLLRDKQLYFDMSHVSNPYGDGTASQRIVNVLLDYFTG